MADSIQQLLKAYDAKRKSKSKSKDNNVSALVAAYDSKQQVPSTVQAIHGPPGSILNAMEKRSQAQLVGAGHGLARLGEGLKQAGLEAAEYLGLVPEGTAQQYTQEVQQQENAYQKTPVANSLPGKVGSFVGESLPLALVPGGAGGNALARLATGAAAGGAIGATQFVPQGGSRARNALLGATAGGATPLAFEGVARGANALADMAGGAIGRQTPGMVQKFVGREITPDMTRRVEAGRRLGVNVRPAEASGSPIQAAQQGRLGKTPGNAEQLIDSATERQGQETAAIQDLLQAVAPDNKSASADIRRASQQIVRDEKDKLQSQAKPLYERAYQDELPQAEAAKLMDDPAIAAAFKKVESDPIFQRELKGVSPTSVKRWDYVKRALDDLIEAAKRRGENNTARILQGAKKDLVGALDEASPDYTAARAIYSQGAEPIKRLEESPIGKLANMSDMQLKRVSQTIFDRQEVDPTTLNNIRKSIQGKDPQAWRRIVRNEMERRLDAVKGERSASGFYNQILAKPRDFNMFLRAAKGMPDVRKKLIDMRRVFKDVINPETVKGAAGKAKSSLDVPRSSLESLVRIAQQIHGGRYDRAAINLVTNPRWDKEFNRIMAKRAKPERLRALGALLGKIAASQGDQ